MTALQGALNQVEELAARYLKNQGDYQNQTSDTGSSWSKSPELNVPKRISRGDLLNNHWSDDPLELEKLFIRVMAWGYGPAGYAKFRTIRVLKGLGGGDQSAGSRLAKWMLDLKQASQRSPIDGFRFLSSDSGRVEFLGPAFSTKLLYFLSPSDNRAPILDSVVHRWLWEHGVASDNEPISVEYSNPDGYGKYVNFCDEATSLLKQNLKAQEQGDRGFVEYLIFQDQLAFDASRTLEPWIRDDRASKNRSPR